MTWTPPIKKRHYINALRRSEDGKLVCHHCAKCKKQVRGDAKGTWFERADQNDVWCFVCSDCFSTEAR